MSVLSDGAAAIVLLSILTAGVAACVALWLALSLLPGLVGRAYLWWTGGEP